MRGKLILIFTVPLTVCLLLPSIGMAQFAIPGHGAVGSNLRGIEHQTWHVFGKVIDLQGNAVREASVKVDVGYGAKFFKDLTTDVQGEFKTEYSMDASLVTSLYVKVTVTREGFHPAHEFVDFGKGDKTWEIDVMMRPDTDDSDELSAEALIQLLAPKLRITLQKDAAIGSDRKDFERGAGDFLDKHDSAKGIESLDKVVKRYPSCANCLTFLGLAMLDAGSWNSAARDFVSAAEMASSKGSRDDKVDSLVILAELENWKGEYAKAAGFLMQAKDLDPKNAFVLQEIGRTLFLQKNWEAAEDYLGQAVTAGASKDAQLLRARAYLEEGDPEAADASMNEYLGKTNIKTYPVSTRRVYSQIEARMKLRDYAKVNSVIGEPLPSLIKAVPELQGLDPASSQTELASVLKKSGETVQAFFHNFQNTISLEQVREERLNKEGKLKETLDQQFQYLLVTKAEKWGLGLEEFRTNSRGDRAAPVGLDSGLMLTSGFASTSLLFHPLYQSGASFRLLGRQALNGHDCYVVAFAQNPEKTQMLERFNTKDASVLVLFQGLAWIDSQSYGVLRLRTDLLNPQTKIRLRRQTTEITYDPVQFKQVASALWLPSEVAVTVEFRGNTYRNKHKYSDFKLFKTDAKDKVQKVDVPQQDPQQQ
jgi:hypothetical protein